MKLSIASSLLLVANVALTSTSSLVMGPDGKPVSDVPYRYTFFYTDTPKDDCDCDVDFYRIVDSMYQEYAHELVFTTTANYTDIDKIDARWNKVAGFYESRSKNIERYRGDYDIWSGRDKYSPDGKYDIVDIMYKDPTLAVGISTPATADSRIQFAQDVKINHIADNTMRDDGSRRKNLRRVLKESDGVCGLQIALGRPKEYDCTTTIDQATGSKLAIDTLKLGSGAAELFYENVDIYLKNHSYVSSECRCKDLINEMKYAVVDITL